MDMSLFQSLRTENSRLNDYMSKLQREHHTVQKQLQTSDADREQLQTKLDRANIQV